MKVPRHVTIIMDGNGRWAQQQGHQRLFGHNAGVESVRACCEYAVEHKIEYLSLFTFSEENWNRPKEEIEGLMELMFNAVLGERESFMKNHIKFRVIGNRDKLSAQLLDNIISVEEETSSNDGLNLIVMLSYSGKWDIVQATNRFAADVMKAVREGKEPPVLDNDTFSTYLSTNGIPDPDLMIRTGGEKRISNYMLWQCAYTEFYYTDVLWPDFRKNEFDFAIKSFNNRERRYGNIK